MVNVSTVLVLYACFLLAANAACLGPSNGLIETGEECDQGDNCLPDCTCDVNFESTDPASVDCIEVCFNPIDPLSSNVESSVSMGLVDSKVDFHAFVEHQSTSETGSSVTGTTITFGTGSACDYPGNSFLSLQPVLDADTCNDEYFVEDVTFSDFSPCLILTCFDKNNNLVNCNDPSNCTAEVAPCKKRWSQSIRVDRSYTVFNANGVSFPASSTAYHPIIFEFPWILSTSVNAVVWNTPDVPGSAAITSVIYNPIVGSWTVVVSTQLDWPYKLVKGSPGDRVNNLLYIVSNCTAPTTGNNTDACIQTLTFIVPGCTGIADLFGGNTVPFDGLQFACQDTASPDCPLEAGTTGDAVLEITLDSDAACGPVSILTDLSQSDLLFLMKQPDFQENRTSFLAEDILSFSLEISKDIPTAAISEITVVSFRETNFHAGSNLVTTKVTTPDVPCASPSTLCFTFDTAQLTNIPTNETSSDLLFVVIIQVDFEGVSKRATLELSNFRFTLPATVSLSEDVDDDDDDLTGVSVRGSVAPILAFIPLLSFLLYF